jgi:NADH:ubiquinone oxidoreductase subunit 3 (subunit A)
MAGALCGSKALIDDVFGPVMRSAGMTGFIEILIFFAILGLGLLYGWKKHALRWE